MVSDVVSDIFKLQHRAECRTSSPRAPCELLSTFIDDDISWASNDNDSTHSYGGAGEENPIKTLQYARDVLSGREAHAHIEWWLEYGCALLCTPSGAAEDMRSYSLVGLDGWTAKTHSYPGKDGCTKRDGTSICTDSTILYVGSVSEARHSDFMEQIHKVLRNASKRKGDARSAASENAHQPSCLNVLGNTDGGSFALLLSKGQAPSSLSSSSRLATFFRSHADMRSTLTVLCCEKGWRQTGAPEDASIHRSCD